MKKTSEISGLGYGCVGLATYESLNYSLRLLDLAYEFGITNFDTAPVYSKGYSEKILGYFARNKRDKIKISSKFGFGGAKNSAFPISWAMALNKIRKQSQQITATTANTTEITYRKIDRISIDRELCASLKRLETDYLDCFLLHEGISSYLTDESKSYLLELKKSGKVKKIGLATNYYQTLNDTEANFWDILQYENDLTGFSDHFINQNPYQQHIYHSCLKKINPLSKIAISTNEYAGLVLAYMHQKNPTGKILFSTGNSNHLTNNVLFYQKYIDYTKQELKDLIDHAIL